MDKIIAWLAVIVATAMVMYAILFGAEDTDAMRICQKAHSFEQCFKTFNPG